MNKNNYSFKEIAVIGIVVIAIIGALIFHHKWNVLNGEWTSERSYSSTLTIKKNNIVVKGEEKQFSDDYKEEPIVGKIDKFKQVIVLYDTKHYLSNKDQYKINYKLIDKKLVLISKKIDDSYEK